MSSGPMHRITICLELVKMAVDDETINKLFSVAEEEIASSSRRIESASHSGDEWFFEAVRDDECDYIEQLLGWAFVAAQTFINTVRSRFVRLSAICKDIGSPLGFVTSAKGHEVLKLADPMRNNPEYREIEVINAIANYWKHQEEWPTRTERERKEEYLERVWDQRQMSKNEKRTIEIVASIGMSPSSTGNLRTAYEAFGLTSSYEDLSPIRDKLRNWAYSLYTKAQSEIAALRKGDLKKAK